MTEQQQFQEGVLPFIKGNIELSTIPDLPSKEIRVYLSSTHTGIIQSYMYLCLEL